ncbi:MAG: TatD family hydrolase, partial [Clostridium sp.]|nr:TatD family hydrolase [Clostridium sp.]
AVGELGLDYFYDFSPRDKQLPLFAFFLSEALTADLPAIVHCRDRDDSDLAYADAQICVSPTFDCLRTATA